MEVTSDHDDHQLRVKIVMRIRMSKVQGGQCSGYGIEFWYKDLDSDVLEPLLV